MTSDLREHDDIDAIRVVQRVIDCGRSARSSSRRSAGVFLGRGEAGGTRAQRARCAATARVSDSDVAAVHASPFTTDTYRQKRPSITPYVASNSSQGQGRQPPQRVRALALSR